MKKFFLIYYFLINLENDVFSSRGVLFWERFKVCCFFEIGLLGWGFVRKFWWFWSRGRRCCWWSCFLGSSGSWLLGRRSWRCFWGWRRLFSWGVILSFRFVGGSSLRGLARSRGVFFYRGITRRVVLRGFVAFLLVFRIVFIRCCWEGF